MSSLRLPKHYFIKIHVYNDDPHCGKGVISLLKLVKSGHSLRSACKEMHIAYSKAWKLVKSAEKDLGASLLAGTAGGSGGGGSKLTPEGEDLLCRYLSFDKDAKKALDSLFQQHFGE